MYPYPLNIYTFFLSNNKHGIFLGFYVAKHKVAHKYKVWKKKILLLLFFKKRSKTCIESIGSLSQYSLESHFVAAPLWCIMHIRINYYQFSNFAIDADI